MALQADRELATRAYIENRVSHRAMHEAATKGRRMYDQQQQQEQANKGGF